ncbi:hypothetical protein GCM10010172_56310 [Paractinoplanes ferrugineus]|uniref:Uncharacterized protein n=1 Tax=Paractinoplanes ferrugineus TaxID=113564 RepID=A0A919IZ55_9ACTN|nr:DUF6114 domain-containing protein [Actinoplanes ferrugineus]GIE10898.1 hypothetical protein Afe05nite_27380 [Actinoplanes ferrugineus]
MATDNFWGKFRRWRRHRPFWGGLFLILSGVELFISANMSLGGIELHLGPQGFLSYLIPIMLLLAGLLIWFTPAQRLFYAIIGLLAALYSFVGLNLGGFFFGMLLGIVGGALAIAWTPRRPRPGAELGDQPPTGEPTDRDEDTPEDIGDDIFGERRDADERRDIEETQRIEIAGHDDRPHDPVRPATRSVTEAPAEGPRPGLGRLGRSPKAMVLAIVPLAVTATVLVVGSNLQASAAVECPEGLPSATSSATSAAGSKAAAAERKAAAKKTTTTTTPAAAKTTAATATKTTAPAAAPAATEDGGGNAVVDGIGDFFDGVGNLLGINDDETSSPSGSPTPSDPATETKEPVPTATTPAEAATTPPATTTPAEAKPDGSSAASVLPAATGDEIPCLGARVKGLVADPDGIPLVAAKPGLMEVDSLTMHYATYDGVVDMPVQGGGSFKALKFSMREADNEPFKLTIAEPGGGKTVISSKKLVTKDNVKFYTPEFKGNLFGVIPVTFTPDSPPPLMLDFLWFTKAKIQLAYVRCDTLTGDPLKVAG